MKFLKSTILGGLALILAAPAQAVVIDFQDMADGPGPIGTFVTGERGFVVLNLLAAYGLDIDITVTDADGNAGGVAGGNNGAGHAYLDEGNAGLGACTVLTGTFQCDPSSDDNVSGPDAGNAMASFETLVFTFNEMITLSNIIFNDNHDGRNLTDETVLIDGVSHEFEAADIIAGTNKDYLYSVGTTFMAGDTLRVGYGGDNASKFYLTSMTATNAVSATGSTALLFLGLGGLFLARRKLK